MSARRALGLQGWLVAALLAVGLAASLAVLLVVLPTLESSVRTDRAKREAQQVFPIDEGNGGNGGGNAHSSSGPGEGNGHSNREAKAESAEPQAEAKPPTTALTETPPVHPAAIEGLELGPACDQCGGMMQRTGSCYTCSSCGNNTGCG